MKTIRTAIAFVAVLCVALTIDAAARHRHHGRHHRATTADYTAPSSTGKRDDATLCDGGPMITADDQIRGCSGLIGSRQTRERKAIAFYNRGNAYFGRHDLARAIDDYTQALSYSPDYVPAYFNRALANRLSGQYQAAVGDYSAALLHQPNDAEALVGRGAAYAGLQQPDKALADFNRALVLKPGDQGALLQRGHYYVRMHAWASAIGDYDAVLAVPPAKAEALYGRGVAKIYSGDVHAGEAELTQALTIDSGIAANMTSQGIPPPQIIQPASDKPIERRKAPEPEHTEDNNAPANENGQPQKTQTP